MEKIEYKAAYFTLGCKLNFAETSTIGQELKSGGVRTAEAGEHADVCVVNTCSVTEVADRKCRQAIRKLVSQHPGALVVVTGCYAQLQPEKIAHIDGVDLVLGAEEKGRVVETIMEALQQRSNKEELSSLDAMPCHQTSRTADIRSFMPSCSCGSRTRYFLKVQDGCDYYCTYCTIPMARGRSRNPKIEDIVSQAQQAIADGAKEIVLTGVNIGDFGRSTGENFTDLVKALDAIDGEFRVRISSCEPNLLTDEIIDYVAQSRHFAPHFHIPLQSGSNEVLKIMHRRYTRELFAERVAHIKRVMPNAFIGVDCMCGVRGETEEYWQDYLQFITSLDVSQLHVFTYSERANTRMLDMDLYIVPKAERERRSKILHQVSEQKLAAFYAAHRGEKATVLWEANGSGWTENYIRVSEGFCPGKVNTFETITIC